MRLTRAARARVETRDAELHALTDRRRFAEWEQRDRITAALLRGGALVELLHGAEATITV